MFLRNLHGPLLEQARAEVELALKVAVLADRGVPRAEIVARLGVGAQEVTAAVRRLQRHAPERFGSPPPPPPRRLAA
jgi:hypothetical protein